MQNCEHRQIPSRIFSAHSCYFVPFYSFSLYLVARKVCPPLVLFHMLISISLTQEIKTGINLTRQCNVDGQWSSKLKDVDGKQMMTSIYRQEKQSLCLTCFFPFNGWKSKRWGAQDCKSYSCVRLHKNNKQVSIDTNGSAVKCTTQP